MSYPKIALKRAMEELTKIRDKKREETNSEKARIYEAVPQLKEINNKIKNAMMSIFDGASVNDVRTELIHIEEQKKEILKAAGISENALSDRYACAICKDEGFYDGNPCVCYLTLIKKEAYKLSNLGARTETENFDTYDENIFRDKELAASFKRCAKRFCAFDKEIKNLLFTGGTGTGKTFLSSCIAKEFLDNGQSVLYLSATKLSDIIDNTKFGKGNVEPDEGYIQFIEECDLLIIDDLGTEYAFSYPQSRIFDILEKRIIDKKRTVISTNLSLNDIAVKYSTRLYSRIMQDYVHLMFTGNDLRTGALNQ